MIRMEISSTAQDLETLLTTLERFTRLRIWPPRETKADKDNPYNLS